MTGCTGRGNPGQWLKPPQLAEHLGMSTDWVQTKVTRGELPFHRLGRLTRFCPECVVRITQETARAPMDRPRLAHVTAKSA